jgi:ribosomal protein S18 acetylase RimI-like enzyme
MMFEFATNRSSAEQLRRHLEACDDRFVPPLSTRVDLQSYSEKLLARAERHEAWLEGELVGLVAIYLNHSSADAYVSNVSVEEKHAGQGLGKHLMRSAREQARSLNFQTMSLEVNSEAHPALKLYEAIGFQLVPSETSDMIKMKCNLASPAELGK